MFKFFKFMLASIVTIFIVASAHGAEQQTTKWYYDASSSDSNKSLFWLTFGGGDLIFVCDKKINAEYFVYQEGDMHYSGKQVVSMNSVNVDGTPDAVVKFDKSFNFVDFLEFVDATLPGEIEVVLSDRTVKTYVTGANDFNKENATMCINAVLDQ